MGMKPTREQYEAAFEAERRNEYPVIDAFEKRMGFAVDRERLEAAARVLACPVKKNAPNWQHGRVIYALGRNYLASANGPQLWVDIGTAKGFSSVCMVWALDDAHYMGEVISFDVINPESREARNSIDDGKTINEFTDPFLPTDVHYAMYVCGSASSRKMWFGRADGRINFAFIDGSHLYEGVKADIGIVAPRQQAGDIILFDDLQVPGVALAVSELSGYDIEPLQVLPKRRYAIAVKQ